MPIFTCLFPSTISLPLNSFPTNKKELYLVFFLFLKIRNSPFLCTPSGIFNLSGRIMKMQHLENFTWQENVNFLVQLSHFFFLKKHTKCILQLSWFRYVPDVIFPSYIRDLIAFILFIIFGWPHCVAYGIFPDQ